MQRKTILIIIVFAQFCCTTLWFAGNAVMSDLLINFGLEKSALGHLSSVVQLGFIVGTFLFALLTVADRFSPSKVFLICAILASVTNIFLVMENNNLGSLLFIRFVVGFFLAGIYPVGMKIAADHFDRGLGKALGLLVGALVLGTAFPHLLVAIDLSIDWITIIYLISGLTLMGGLCMFVFVPDGPYRKASQGLDLSSCFTVFKNREFRRAAIGYFGHMWELYAFWVFIPVIISSYITVNPGVEINISLWSFYIIAIGGVSCVLGGYLSSQFGLDKMARLFLLFSCICCLFSPFLFRSIPVWFYLSILLFWGATVIGDSPLFSTLVAQSVDPETKGTALTIVTCIGFALTIISIEVVSLLQLRLDPHLTYIVLALGPVIGLVFMQLEKR